MIPLRKTDEDNLSAEERAEIEEAWGRESERRLAEYESGKAKGIPAEKVHQYLDACIKGARK
ncbi:MAG: addiction module protein [Candidatus Omnitrophota bacterium]